MENKDTKTDYQEVVRPGDQKWEMVEITIGIIFSFFLFFCFLRFIFIIFYICTGSFQVLPKKITPSQSANSHPKFQQFDLISYYINLKNGSISSDNAAEVLYIRKNQLERLLDKKSTCNFVYSIQCIQWKIYSRKPNSPQLWFEDPILGILTPSWAPRVVWN